MQRPEVKVMTPERVELVFTLAGIGTRALAFLIDRLIILGVYVLFALAAWGLWYALPARLHDVLIGVMVILAFFTPFLYHIGCEYSTSGQTVGKRCQRIRVVRRDGRPVTFAAAAVRNVLRVVDGFPVGYLAGVVVMLIDPKARRVGDLAAGTMVVLDNRRLQLAPLPAGTPWEDAGTSGGTVEAAPPASAAVTVRLPRRHVTFVLHGELPPGWEDTLRALVKRRRQLAPAIWRDRVREAWEATLALPGVALLRPPDERPLTPREQAQLLRALVRAVRKQARAKRR
ncbi:RDD family protein, partial [Alicyclobacillus cellulosilyticus]|uniref:RDD family protein n=1 Tax=Alicyclobacillus cellulosilyticus TaxID=1003997 RepID=UPI0016693E06